MLYILDQALVELVGLALVDALVDEGDFDAAVEVSQLAQALGEGGVDEGNTALVFGEEGGVGLKTDLGAGAGGLADCFEAAALAAALEFHVMHLTVAADFDFEPFGNEVDDGRAHAVEAA